MRASQWLPGLPVVLSSALLLTLTCGQAAIISPEPGDAGLRAALAAAQNGDRIVLTNSVQLLSTVTLEKRVTIAGSASEPWRIRIYGEFDGDLFHITTNGVAFEWTTLAGSSQTDGLALDGEVTLRDCFVTDFRRPVNATLWTSPNSMARLARVTVTRNLSGFECVNLEATDCTFSYSRGYSGAAAWNGVFDRCRFENNLESGLIATRASVKNCTFRYNGGFGLWFDPDPGVLSLRSSVFYANGSGGLFLGEEAFATVDNCTFTRHTGPPAIVIWQATRVLFRHCTVADNLAIAGSSPWYWGSSAFIIGYSGSVRLQNCLIADNPTSASPHAAGIEAAEGYWSDGGGNIIGGPALLGVLQDHGGPTLSMLPQPGSPAINAAQTSELVTDARGLARLAGAAPDAGATETGTAAVVDTDADGLPDIWEEFYSLNAANPADALSDTDGDGQPAITEYRARTNPLDTASVLRIEMLHIDSASESSPSATGVRNVSLTWQRSGSGLAEVETSTDLREWRRAPGTYYGGYVQQFWGTTTSPTAFYRLRTID